MEIISNKISKNIHTKSVFEKGKDKKYSDLKQQVNIQKSPANPEFYKNYIGLNKKISFGQNKKPSQNTPQARLNYLLSLKKANGTENRIFELKN